MRASGRVLELPGRGGCARGIKAAGAGAGAGMRGRGGEGGGEGTRAQAVPIWVSAAARSVRAAYPVSEPPPIARRGAGDSGLQAGPAAACPPDGRSTPGPPNFKGSRLVGSELHGGAWGGGRCHGGRCDQSHPDLDRKVLESL